MSRHKLEALAALIILILLGLLLFFILRAPTADTPVPNQVQEPVADVLPVVDLAEVPAPGAVSASTIARTFVERFGSYSSESDFANVDDVMTLATPNYQAELEILVDDYRRQLDAEAGYTGISTIVIGMTVQSESETATTFLVTTQREESVGNPGNSTLRYQDVEISLIKSGDDWLVDALTWK